MMKLRSVRWTGHVWERRKGMRSFGEKIRRKQDHCKETGVGGIIIKTSQK
jgi:hypothetical protein